MTQKFKNKMKEKIDELVFGFIILLATSGVLYYSLHNGITDLQVMSFIGVKLSLYVFVGALFTKFFNGIGFNMNKEIFEEHNMSAAILIGLFWVGLAIAISSGNLG